MLPTRLHWQHNYTGIVIGYPVAGDRLPVVLGYPLASVP